MVLLKQQQEIHGSTVTFSLTGLSNYTTYYFKVDVSDEKGGSATGTETSAMTLCSATYCSGKRTTTKTCTASGCDGGTVLSVCPSYDCQNGWVECSLSFVFDVDYSSRTDHAGSCYTCGTSLRRKRVLLSEPGDAGCGIKRIRGWEFCSDSCAMQDSLYGTLEYCGNRTGHSDCDGTGYIESGVCSTCGGDGEISSTTNCSHGNSSSHYVCSTHGYNGSTSSHS